MDRKTRELVWKRAEGICEYCHISSDYFTQRFQIEHIIPKKHHGGDELGNLALACERCNLHKGPNIAGRNPTSGEVIKLFHPRVDEWSEHFSDLESGRIRGISSVGEVTVDVLAMNATNRVALRSAIWSLRQEPNQ